jgi:hypothetical protein
MDLSNDRTVAVWLICHHDCCKCSVYAFDTCIAKSYLVSTGCKWIHAQELSPWSYIILNLILSNLVNLTLMETCLFCNFMSTENNLGFIGLMISFILTCVQIGWLI